MKILAIETSCDETSAAVVEKNESSQQVMLRSHVIVSSLKLHGKTGGIIPEEAAREQVKYIIPVIDQAILDAHIANTDIHALAVTIGPGLIGSLLIGVETAKTLAYAWNKPIIPVNHLIGHLYANFLTANNSQLTNNNPNRSGVSSQLSGVVFPALGLIISGGHTDLVLMKDHGDITLIGGTRDDAAGEAFDKIGRMLGFPYPSGATIEQKAKHGNAKRFNFPRPMLNNFSAESLPRHSGGPAKMSTSGWDFSFSGLKAAASREIQKLSLDEPTINDICAGIQEAIIRVVVKKTLLAAEKYAVKSILLGGGVASNQSLTNELEVRSKQLGVELFVPPKNLCTDNAGMIGASALFNYHPKSWTDINANPELYFG